MGDRRIYDSEGHAFFVTFSCWRRRRLLDHPVVRDSFCGLLAETNRQHGAELGGYVVMPDHVHLIVGFCKSERLSRYIQSLKQGASQKLKRVLKGVAPSYADRLDLSDPFWQPKYYPFNLYTERKTREKLEYMHLNPVEAGLVERAVDWSWSSARHYLMGEDSVVPVAWTW